MSEKLVVLAIEDDAGDAEILARNLERIEGLEVEFVHLADPSIARREIEKRNVDVTFLDYRLGESTGLEVIERIRTGGHMGPVIVLTGNGDEYAARDLMRAGADDYMLKGDVAPETLRRSIESSRARFVERRISAENLGLVSELRKAKASLEHRNKQLAELYTTAHRFVDDVSHEFRTPLTVVKDFASILRDEIPGPVNEDQREYLSIIISRVDDLVSMVSDMLDVSKIEAGKLGIARRATTVYGVIDRVGPTIERRAADSRSRFVTEIPEGLPPIYCDEEKIARVLLNLVVNALKFTKDGGGVTLWARREEAGEVVFGVTDDGPGIRPEHLQEIFQRFQQVDGMKAGLKGFGLGLSIARQLVQLNLGDIRVDSEYGKGSTFSFTVPEADPAPLIERYISRVGQLREGATHLSVVRVLSEHAESVSDARVEHFLHYETRHTDLVIATGPGSWLLVLPASKEDAEEVMRRLLAEREDTNAHSPGEKVARLKLRMEGTWRLGDDRNAGLLESFSEIVGGMERLPLAEEREGTG